MGDKVNSDCNKAILELSNGNRDALSTIYDCMARMIFSVSYAILGNYQDAEDVLQDTMIEVAKYAHTYRKDSNAKAWILKMSRNLAIDIIRKRKPMELYDEESSVPCSDFSNIEVLDILSRLDEEEKQIVVFRLYADMPYKEISRIIEISVAATQKKYQRAIKKLRKVI